MVCGKVVLPMTSAAAYRQEHNLSGEARGWNRIDETPGEGGAV